MTEEAKNIIFKIYEIDLFARIRNGKVFLVDFDKWLNREKALGITYFGEDLILPIVFISLKVPPAERLTTVIHEFIHVICEIQKVEKYLEHDKEFKI